MRLIACLAVLILTALAGCAGGPGGSGAECYSRDGIHQFPHSYDYAAAGFSVGCNSGESFSGSFDGCPGDTTGRLEATMPDQPIHVLIKDAAGTVVFDQEVSGSSRDHDFAPSTGYSVEVSGWNGGWADLFIGCLA